jgi:hypothetical protein
LYFVLCTLYFVLDAFMDKLSRPKTQDPRPKT